MTEKENARIDVRGVMQLSSGTQRLGDEANTCSRVAESVAPSSGSGEGPRSKNIVRDVPNLFLYKFEKMYDVVLERRAFLVVMQRRE